MDDLISRQQLRLMKTEECAGHTIEYAMGWKACIDWIKSLPSIEPRKGRWIDDGSELGCQCSECLFTLDDYVTNLNDNNHLRSFPNFCPNCWADMREGEQDEDD